MQILVTILGLDIVLLGIYVRNLNKQLEDKQGLIRARTKSVKELKRNIDERDKFIEFQQEKIEKQKEFINKICENTIRSSYNNKIAKLDQIIELVRDYQSKN